MLPLASEQEARAVDPDDDHPKEACGVFGVYAPGQPVAQLTYLGLFALQHRGQESAGMAVSDGDEIMVMKDQGLVASVFDDRKLASFLPGHLAMGHCRYSTTGASTWRNAQPVFRSVGDDIHTARQFALGHNGNLVNTEALVAEAGMLPGTVTSDTDLVAALLADELGHCEPDGTPHSLEGALLSVLPRLQGAFSFVLMDEEHVIGVRDPQGFRPLCLGRLDDGGWILASESPALDIVGASFVRELDPGEMVVIDSDGPHSVRPFSVDRVDPKLCLFEFVYFARPDSKLYGRSVHQARIHMGEQLAEQAPADADMVMGVPESGVPAAEGFSRRSGIPFGQGLVKNRYIGRSFIAPSQEARAQAVRMKFNPLRENLAGKSVVVVDDSIVRGTTQRQLIAMLREAGARQVHLRITSPPVKWSCFYGIDTGDRRELLGAKLDVEQIRVNLGADSLSYLNLDRLTAATGAPGAGFCDACFTGDYPVDVPVTLRKHVLEQNEMPIDDIVVVQPTLRALMGQSYESAGVNIAAGEEAVERIKAKVRSTFRPEVIGDIGGFGGLFAFPTHRFNHPVLVSSTDGVGTKALVAQAAGRFETIGVDLVAMCVDDLACQGAEPLFFLDYIAVGKLDPDHIEQLVEGVASGCRQAGCALIGGEMAEHPGAMEPGEFDLVGFAVGAVERDRIITGAHVQAGDALIGLPSPGLRSNGYSLARKVFFEVAQRSLDAPAFPGAHHTLADELLEPSVIYAPAIAALLRQVDVRAIAHITGGGIPGNLNRCIPSDVDAVVERSSWESPRIFGEIQRLGEIDDAEMAKVFNLGIGMIVVVPPNEVHTSLDVLRTAGHRATEIGRIAPGSGRVQLR